MVIDIQYLPGAPRLEQIDNGDWIDLYTYEDVTLKAGAFCLFNLGVAMSLPQGYEALMAPRSSTFKRWGLLQTNSVGVVDNSYCGPDDIWKWPAIATEDVTIPKGTRLCQFRIIENQPRINFNQVTRLKNKNRSGFGSTGA